MISVILGGEILRRLLFFLFLLKQFGHCPKAREGPALGCNYCWNTTDSNGRILRRKTKYHCPECQANLCIVPCFQQYHEALERDETKAAAEGPAAAGGGGGGGGGGGSSSGSAHNR